MISLMATAVSGCASCLKGFKKNHKLYAVDVKHSVCLQYKIIGVREYEFEKALPLIECDGYFAVSPAAFNDARQCAESTAKSCQSK